MQAPLHDLGRLPPILKGTEAELGSVMPVPVEGVQQRWRVKGQALVQILAEPFPRQGTHSAGPQFPVTDKDDKVGRR